jgi:hypothetical protein
VHHGGEEVDRLAVFSQRAPQGLAVEREHELVPLDPPGAHLVEQPGADHLVERASVDGTERSAEGLGVGGDVALGERVVLGAEAGEHLLGASHARFGQP